MTPLVMSDLVALTEKISSLFETGFLWFTHAQVTHILIEAASLLLLDFKLIERHPCVSVGIISACSTSAASRSHLSLEFYLLCFA